MSRERRHLLLAGAVAGIALLLTLLGFDNVVVRAILGIPLVLFLPGYVFSITFLKPELSGPERTLLSTGLSLSLSICVGLILNIFPWGIQPNSWALALSGTTLALVLFALTRRTVTLPEIAWHIDMPIMQGLLLVAAAILVVVAVGVARTGAGQAKTPGFTQLWLLPADQAHPNVRVGIRNQEAMDTSYILRVNGDGVLIREWPAIDLAPGQTWETTLDLTPTQASTASIEAALYNHNASTTVYRHARLLPPTATPTPIQKP